MQAKSVKSRSINNERYKSGKVKTLSVFKDLARPRQVIFKEIQKTLMLDSRGAQNDVFKNLSGISNPLSENELLTRLPRHQLSFRQSADTSGKNQNETVFKVLKRPGFRIPNKVRFNSPLRSPLKGRTIAGSTHQISKSPDQDLRIKSSSELPRNRNRVKDKNNPRS